MDVTNVLLRVKESKRVLVLHRNGREAAIRSAVRSVDRRIHVVFDDREDIPSNALPYILQRYNAEWEDYVDVADVDVILDRDRLLVIPAPSSIGTVAAGAEGPSTSALTETATSISQSLFNVSGTVKQKMSSLFPSGGYKCNFDPMKVDSTSVKKKRKLIRVKLVRLTVMAVKGSTYAIPRGVHKKKLLEEGREQEIEITKVMTSREVQNSIVSAYKHLGISHYEILQSGRNGQLSVAEEQFPSGASLMEGPYKRKATLYIRKKMLEDDEGFPSASNILKKRATEPVIDLSEDRDTNANEPVQNPEPLLPTIPPISFYSTHSSELEEFRRIREEQDAEYSAMLENDMALENAVASQDGDHDEENTINKQDVLEEKEQLKNVLNDSFNGDGYHVRVRLPGESSANLSCSFGIDVTTKNLYQYAFAFSNIEGKFFVYMMSPRLAVPCSELLLGDGRFGHVFAVEEHKDGIDPATLFNSDKPLSDLEDHSLENNETVNIYSMPMQEGTAASMGSSNLEAVQLPNLENEDQFMDVLKKTEQECQTFLQSFCKPGQTHSICRSHLYDDTLCLFSEDSPTNEYPFSVKYEGEIALDCGGVARDLLSGFWEEATRKVFDGCNLLIPTISPEVNIQVFPIMGRLLSHGFLACSYLPVVIAFPTLVSTLMGPAAVVQDSILLEVFSDSLTDVEAKILQEALENTAPFTQKFRKKLIQVLARFNCREIPTNETIKKVIINISRYEFLSKPLAATTLMNSGIPVAHKVFWEGKTVDELYKIYIALTATPSKVLEVLNSDTENENQERVLAYLQQFIGSMSQDMIRRFLRFVTGSSVCLSSHITVVFNESSGFCRSPVGHTCTSTLELPATYISYPEFMSEFKHILLQPENEWKMNIR